MSSSYSSPRHEESELSRSASQDSAPTEVSASDHKLAPRRLLETGLSGLYSESTVAKIWKVAAEGLVDGTAPPNYPEWAPEDGPTPGRYNTREVNFWTCGFFPGSLYCLLERSVKYPMYLPAIGNPTAFHNELLRLCKAWAAPMHQMSYRTNTHDMGFITQPALRQDWELNGNVESLASIVRAAENLASRWVESMQAVRSWDRSISLRYDIKNKEENFLVIVDSMCNLDLLYYAGHHSGNQRLIDVATSHAHYVRTNHIRNDNSTWHVVNRDPRDGSLKTKHTHQGYAEESTWSRGQAWTMLGFAQTYIWTKDPSFLDAAIRLSDYFIKRLRSAAHSHAYVPLWDFDAPIEDAQKPLRDTSAGMIAANGLVLLHQILGPDSPYLEEALHIARDTIALSQAQDPARLTLGSDSKITVEGVTFDSILKNATANHNEYASIRYSNHGLVYADYYFLELGNKLLRMGFI